MCIQEYPGMENQELEPELQPESESHDEEQPEIEIEDDANKEEANEDNSKDVEEDQSSPRGVLDISSDQSQESFSPSASSKSLFEKAAIQKENSPESHGSFRGFMEIVRKSSMKKLSSSTIALFSGHELSRRSIRRKLARMRSAEDAIDCGILPETKLSWRNFDYAELASATDDFSAERMIGKGGHAEVYKGCLADGTVVAVKKLHKTNKDEEDRIVDFLSELGIIAHVDHPNAAKLIGFSIENGLYLILQYAPCGSLASQLHGSMEGLNWEVRYRVAIGVAEGLAYLHHSCQRRIIHRDIKASNILLCEDFEPMISDFGLAKWLPDKWIQHVVHPIEGTFGYLAPEYFMHGIVDEKTDVFAFGVVLLEILTGRHAVDSRRQSLVMWAKPLLESSNVKELIDPRLEDEYDPEELQRAMSTAAMCIHHDPLRRPHMSRVVELLRGEGVPMDSKPRSAHPRSMLLDAYDLEGYTCTTYLRDLTRHRELLME